jgi:hypothetical protein
MVTPSLFFTNIEKKGNGLSQNSKVSLRGKQRYILLFPPKQSINFEPKTQKKTSRALHHSSSLPSSFFFNFSLSLNK